MTYTDLDKKIESHYRVPSQEEINQARAWVRNNFPYSVTPSYNPGQAGAIQEWLDKNIGSMDDAWTWIDREIRFRRQEDYVLYGMTWQKFDENIF